MAGEIIRPKDLTPRPAPVASELMVVDNSVNVGAATIKAIVEAGRPAASQAEAIAGTDAAKAMTPLTTKQSVAAEVGVSLASKAQGDKADISASSERTISVGPGLTGGGDLTEDRTIGLSSATNASLSAADSAVQPEYLGGLATKSTINNSDWLGSPLAPSNGGQPPGGGAGQVLIKASSTDFDATWETVAAATAVSYAPQTLLAGQQSQARSNIDAASTIDVRRNLWVNGSFAVSQENGNTLGTASGYYPADQIALYFVASAAAMSAQRIQVRTLANALDQIEFKTTTAKAVLAAGDSVTLTQNIEGSAFASAGFGTAAAVPLVLRAEVKLPAGTYHWHFQNAAGNRHCAVPFTIAGGEANIAVIKEIVVPADTSGTWLTADGVIGITCDLVLAAGSGKTGGSASTWGGTAYLAASAQANILSSTANVARLADVGLKLDPTGAGVYGAYRVNETDAVYRSERYAARYGSYPMGLALSASRTYPMGTVTLQTTMAKTPALLSGAVFSVNTGPAGTPIIDTVIAANSAKAVAIFNSADNWSANAFVAFSGVLTARLS